MTKAGMMLIVGMIVGCLGVVGGVENLGPQPTFNEIATLIAFFIISLGCGVQGLKWIKEGLE
jgi:hypothetical protein